MTNGRFSFLDNDWDGYISHALIPYSYYLVHMLDRGDEELWRTVSMHATVRKSAQ